MSPVAGAVSGPRDAGAGTGAAALRAALERLDVLLRAAADRVDAALARHPADVATRGLYVDRADVDGALRRPPLGDRTSPAPPGTAPTGPSAGPWRRLGAEADLSGFDLDVVLVALAPEVDLRYERLYAYLQDDVTRRRPTVALVLDLLCGSPEERLARRGRFAASAPLLAGGVVRLVADPHHVDPPLLARYVVPDEQVVALLLGDRGGDHRLAGAVEVHGPPAPPQPRVRLDLVERVLAPAATAARAGGPPLVLHLEGPAGAGRQRLAHALAACCGTALAVVDVPALLAAPDAATSLHLAVREARWRDAVPYLAGADALLGPERSGPRRAVLRALAAGPPVAVLAGERPWEADGGTPVHTVELGALDPADAREWWTETLRRAGTRSDPAAVDAVAERFRLTPAAIESAVAGAVQAARVRAPRADAPEGPSAADLLAAARRTSGLGLAALAQEVEARRDWAELVLPADSAAQLREIEDRLTHRGRVLDEWGFGPRLGRRTGTTALFSGSSGTGKTLAAEVLAHRLGVALYRIDLSGVVSKYIGETEKNLARLFDAAGRSGAILFFDEADALFGKRSEVRDSHDRYANVEVSYLLQRMDDYDGLAVLATNLRSHLDEAFLRRLDFTVSFPFPDEAARARIWAGPWPPDLPLGPDVDAAVLATRFPLSGGNIRNAALAAAFAAAAEDRPVGMDHVLHAVRREYQKFGKAVDGTGRTG